MDENISAVQVAGDKSRLVSKFWMRIIKKTKKTCSAQAIEIAVYHIKRSRNIPLFNIKMSSLEFDVFVLRL